MSFLSIFDAVTPVVNKILDFIPDPAQKLEAQQLLLTQIAASDAQQNAINQAEAQNSSLFVSGARPFILWCCGLGFCYHLIIEPLLTYLMAVFGHTFPLPVFDTAMLSSTTWGMLGLGAYRTVEKMGDKGQMPWQK